MQCKHIEKLEYCVATKNLTKEHYQKNITKGYLFKPKGWQIRLREKEIESQDSRFRARQFQDETATSTIDTPDWFSNVSEILHNQFLLECKFTFTSHDWRAQYGKLFLKQYLSQI